MLMQVTDSPFSQRKANHFSKQQQHFRFSLTFSFSCYTQTMPPLYGYRENIYSTSEPILCMYFSAVETITLKGILSTNWIPHTLFILLFSQPFRCKTTYRVYCLMGPSGALTDFSTAPSFYLINTALPSHSWCYAVTTSFLFSSEAPFLLPNWRPLFNVCTVFCHFVQFAPL